MPSWFELGLPLGMVGRSAHQLFQASGGGGERRTEVKDKYKLAQARSQGEGGGGGGGGSTDHRSSRLML